MPFPNPQAAQPVPLFTPWLFVYLAIAMAASFVILLLAFLIGLRQTDLPVLSWIYIGLGGIVAEVVMRARMGVCLVAWKTPQLPFIWVWLALVVLAAVVGPKQTPTAWPTDQGCDSVFAVIRGGVA